MFYWLRSPLTPDRIYATNLALIGYGYPLWVPEPHESGETQIGDVGFLLNGRFVRLFSLDTFNQGRKVTFWDPPFNDIKPLPRGALKINRTDRLLISGHYCSHGVQSKDVYASADVATGAGTTAGLQAEYTCKEAQGAALTLKSEAHAEEIFANHHLKQYILRHFDRWRAYATEELGQKLERAQIVVVSGWVKTSADWAATVFSNNRLISSNVSIGGRAGALGGLELGGWHSASSTSSLIQRQGRDYPAQAPTPVNGEVRKDQCVFIKRLTVRRRFGIVPKLVGGAGEHQLPKPEDGSGSPGAGGIGSDLHETKQAEDEVVFGRAEEGYIPDLLDILFDYIFEISDAETAIAGDEQVESILGQKVVVDFASHLRQARLRVDVDDDGVGYLCAEDLVRHQAKQKFENRIVTSADRAEWLNITHRDAGVLQDSRVDLGFKQTKTKSLAFNSLAFGNREALPINSYYTVSLCNKGELLAAAVGKTIIIWRLQDGLTVQRLGQAGHTKDIDTIAFSPDDQQIVSGSADGLSLVWDVKTGDILHRLRSLEDAIHYVAYSPDGTLIASRSKRSLMIWDALTGVLLHEITTLGTEGSLKIMFMPGSSCVAARSDTSVSEKSIVLLDCRTGGTRTTLHKQAIRCMAFSPTGARSATGSTDRNLCVWSAESGEVQLEAELNKDWITCVAFSPDGEEIASASADGTVVTCNSWTGKRRFTLRVEGTKGSTMKRIYTVLYSPKNDFIACGAGDGCVRVWNAKSGAFVATFRGHSSPVWHLMFTPDGWNIVSCSTDHTAKLWSIYDATRLWQSYGPDNSRATS